MNLDDILHSSEQYETLKEFVIVCGKFKLLKKNDDWSLRREIADVYEQELGTCDECYRPYPRCECSRRYDDYDDDEYDRYYDR